MSETVNDHCTPDHDEDVPAAGGRLVAMKKHGDTSGEDAVPEDSVDDGVEGGPTSMPREVKNDDGQQDLTENDAEHPSRLSVCDAELALSRLSMMTSDNVSFFQCTVLHDHSSFSKLNLIVRSLGFRVHDHEFFLKISF